MTTRAGVVFVAAIAACGGTHRSHSSEVRPEVPASSRTAPALDWRIVVGPDLRLDERLCWRGFHPEDVLPERADAAAFARVTREDGAPAVLDDARAGTRVTTTSGCLRIELDLAAMARALDDDRALVSFGDAVYGSFDAWLWRPRVWPRGLRGRLFMETPPGVAVSLPFRRSTNDGAFDVPVSAWSYMARGAIGKLVEDSVDVAGARLSIGALPGTAPSASRRGVRRSVEGAAAAVALLDGRMPVDRVQILVLPGGRGHSNDPVQFGMAMRGGGPTVLLYLSNEATDERLFGEWIGVHELSHLWLPPLDAESTWLSEGFASYYQCVLRSRAGMVDEVAAWDELVSGFERGRAQAGHTSLTDARVPRFQQIYWGGAALFFKMDVALREAGKGSLDAAVAAVRREIVEDDPETLMPAGELLARLSRAADHDLRAIVAAGLGAPFPDVSRELRAIGVVRRNAAERRVILDDSAPLAPLRKAIATRR